MVYHGKVIGPDGQVYFCEHNHRTMTAAITCANSSRTRQMAAMEWNQAAIRAAQAAALAKKRAEERAAAQARRIAAEEAATARRAADRAAAEEAKAAKRAAKLAAMPPQRAWKRMTPEERLLKIAETELGFYGKIISPEAKAAYDARAAKRTTANAPAPSESVPPKPTVPPTTREAANAPAYMRALDPSLTPYERALAREQAEGDPEQWQKYVAALRAQQVERDLARLKASANRGSSVPARGTHSMGPARSSALAPSQPVPPVTAVPAKPRRSATESVHSESDPRPAAVAHSGLSGGAGGGVAEVRSPMGTTGSNPAAESPAGFGGDGLFVVGLDITPGVYRTPGAAGGRHGYFKLLKSTSIHDIQEFSLVKGPTTITVGPGVRAVQVRGCQPWSRLGDNLDAVIAAASELRNTAIGD